MSKPGWDIGLVEIQVAEEVIMVVTVSMVSIRGIHELGLLLLVVRNSAVVIAGCGCGCK